MPLRRWLPILVGFALLVVASLAPILVPSSRATSQSPSELRCEPLAPLIAKTPATPPSKPTGAETPGEPVVLKVGFIPISIYAPVFVAAEKGYYAEEGLDVDLEALPGGADLVALTAAGQLQAASAGAGPAFWNGLALGLPLTVIAPGHFEGSPVATPLMISRRACESGAIASVADLRGRKVSVNARGATEYWLAQALSTGGLTLDDIDLQTVPFPEAVLALESGSIDAAMVAEPLATKAELDGLAVRLAADFPVQDVMPTALIANSDWAAANPEATTGLVRAYLRAAADLQNGGFQDAETQAIIETYSGVPADLIGSAVPPRYAPDGVIDPASMAKLQTFFRGRGQLEYDDDIDPSTIIDPSYAERAVGAVEGDR